jgi:uncharacterized protein YcbX
MFDEPTSLPMRAAIASLLGGLFGIALILVTNSAQAQAQEATVAPAHTVAADAAAVIRRIGDATLRTLSHTEPAFGLSTPGARGLRLTDHGTQAGSGLRWQMARIKELRSEGDIPRSRDLISVGVQVRF